MVTSSNNAKSKGGARDVLAANQNGGSSFNKKSSPAADSPSKPASFANEEEHLIRKCDTLISR